jgi:APA family basic amino acid/polyamine antiporter
MLAFAFSLFGIAGSGYQIVYLGFLLLILGIPIYLIVAWNKQRAAARLVAPGAVQFAQGEPQPTLP